MPIFEYRCKECNEKFDILHKSLSNMEEVVCPKCGSKDSRKLISGFSASVDSSSDIPSCSTGSCNLPPVSGGCANGMCGLN